MSRATCDTSVLVPALLPWHEHHDETRFVVRDEVASLGAHVLLECYSVLTRLPAPSRIAPAAAAGALAAIDLPLCSLPESEVAELVATLGRAGLRGGTTYDALVGATAAAHGLELITRDRRAARTYDVVGAVYRML